MSIVPKLALLLILSVTGCGKNPNGRYVREQIMDPEGKFLRIQTVKQFEFQSDGTVAQIHIVNGEYLTMDQGTWKKSGKRIIVTTTTSDVTIQHQIAFAKQNAQPGEDVTRDPFYSMRTTNRWEFQFSGEDLMLVGPMLKIGDKEIGPGVSHDLYKKVKG